jgi:fructose-1,6-bisphosphatase/inositol monophosphatase family enzyme
MPEISFAAELRVARQAADAAAALLTARAGAERVRAKARADLVTEVDEASERAVVATIRAASRTIPSSPRSSPRRPLPVGAAGSSIRSTVR